MFDLQGEIRAWNLKPQASTATGIIIKQVGNKYL